MTQVKRMLSAILAFWKRFGKAVKAQPFGLLAALCGTVSAVLAVFLPWEVPKILNDLSLGVAKRLAGTGTVKLAPIRTAALGLLGKTALVAALYLLAIWCALRCAKKLRGDLRAAVEAKRAFYESEGHTPPPDWEKDVRRDIDLISAMVAAAPEWLMVLAGLVWCVLLMTRAPLAAAIWIPVTAVAVCVTRDILRQRRVLRAIQLGVTAAIWSAGALLMVLRAVQPVEPGIPLGTLALLLIGMALVVPAALQLPYRNLIPAWRAYQRVRGFLK